MLTKVLLCAVCALGAAATPAVAAFPGHNGKIAYESYRDGDVDIWTMSPNGRHQTNLTHASGAIDASARWSADGRKIVFMSNRVTAADPSPGDFEIFVMDADGSDQRQVTFNSIDDFEPAWSPDGDRIVFERIFADFDADLFTIRANGTGELNVTDSPGVMDREAAWSPDGREIAFSIGGNAGRERGDIATIRPDGAHLRRLTFTDADEGSAAPAIDEESPAWTPDGRRIAFTSDSGALGRQFDVYAINRDGGHPTRLTFAECGAPAWSPDGRKLACGSSRTGDSEVWTMRFDGSRPRNRTQSPLSQDGFPDWQPLGNHERAEEDDDYSSSGNTPPASLSHRAEGAPNEFGAPVSRPVLNTVRSRQP
jgi:TolB protein